jgi:putative flippase GtrA
VRSLIHKLMRYATVSVISTGVSMCVLGGLVATATLAAGWANVVATAVGTVPSFELNRRWVWGRTGRRSLTAEIGPFCALSFAGLALSTLAVTVLAAWAAHAHLGTGGRTLAAEAGNVAAFGSLWVLQFVVLERLLFRPRHTSAVTPVTGAETASAATGSREGPSDGDRDRVLEAA